MTSRPFAWVLAALVCLPLACRDAAPADAAPPAPSARRPLTPVRMNINQSLTYSALVIAREEGYFEDEGIDARFVELDLNQVLLAASTGEVDVISTPLNAGLFNLISRGAPLRIVADKGHSAPGDCSAEAFVAPIATAERIARTRSLRNETFVIRRAGITEFVIETLLEKKGLTTADVRFAQIPNSEYLTAVQDRMDALMYVQEPKLSQLVSSGLVKMVITAEEVDPGHQFSVISFGPRLLQREPELGRRVMRAYLRGIRQYNEGKTPRNLAILSKHSRIPEAILRKACWVAIAPDGRIAPRALDTYLAWAERKGYLDRPVGRNDWWNPSFIDAAETAAR